MKYRPDPGTLAGLLVIIVVAIAVFLLVLGLRAHARSNEAWQAQKVQAEIEGDVETLRRLRYVGTAGTLPCPGPYSIGWCQPDRGFHQPCCGEADAYEADVVEVDGAGNTWAVLTCNDPKDCQDIANKVRREPGEKFIVPAARVLLNHDPVNDTGHGWVWISPSSTDAEGRAVVYCWAAPAGL